VCGTVFPHNDDETSRRSPDPSLPSPFTSKRLDFEMLAPKIKILGIQILGAKMPKYGAKFKY